MNKIDIIIEFIVLLIFMLLFVLTMDVSAEEYTANRLTHYGYNCRGCSGITASGWNIKKKGTMYKDKEYGTTFICATSKKIKMYSIIQFKHKKYGVIKCTVLDRGVSGTNIDLLTTSEKKASKLGVQRSVTVKVLRKGRG